MKDQQRVIVLGTAQAGITLVRELLKRPELNLKVVGFLDEKGENIGKSLVNPSIIGSVHQVSDIVKEKGVSRVILSLNERRGCGGLRNDGVPAVRIPTTPITASIIAALQCLIDTGDNIVARPRHMSWYRGPTLLEYLETVELATRSQPSAFRMPVQWVIRPNSEFRGYCGLIASGEISPGTQVQILPSGQRTHLERIVTADGDLTRHITTEP